MKFALALLVASFLASAQTPWFHATNGDTTCQATTVSLTPLSFGFYCSNPRGSVGGSYTAASSNTATDVVTAGLSGTTGTTLCMFAVNATNTPLSLGSFGPTPIPAGTVAWSCSSQGSNAGSQGSFALNRRAPPKAAAADD